MSVPLNVGDLVEVKFACYCGNQAGINVRHYKVLSESGTGADLDDVSEFFDTTFATAYRAVLASDASWYGCSAQVLAPAPGSNAEVDANHIGIGDLPNGNALPTQVSGLITVNTALAGRANRGRIYVPFPGENSNEGTTHVPTGDYVDDLVVLADLFEDTYTVGTAPNQSVLGPVILHRAAMTTTPVEGCRAREYWATQRRRGSAGATNAYPPL